jgi:hypothetical protein
MGENSPNLVTLHSDLLQKGADCEVYQTRRRTLTEICKQDHKLVKKLSLGRRTVTNS